MKALKIILIIIGALVAAMLIVPLFAPATAEVSAEIEIAREPSEIFPLVASFQHRDAWDPWVDSDSTTEATIESKPGYVGSAYSWDGEKLGTGRMEVISVRDMEYIRSSLWFGDVEEPSLVEWNFRSLDVGTHVTWSFSQETRYPVGRLGMIFGKMFLNQSFEAGLSNLKAYIESQPRSAGPPGSGTLAILGPITIEIQQPIVAMVADGAGTMESIGQQLGELYGMIMMEVGSQQLEVVGAPFVHYLDFDETTGHSNYMAGIPVAKTGVISGQVHSISYAEMEVVQAIHMGPYEEFTNSYGKMDQYIRDNSLEITGEAFEFYLTDPGSDPDPANWKTLISFPLEKNGL